MALQKQSLSVNFAQGLDTKTDKFQVSPGKFLALQNTVFTKGNQLTKRNGYGALTSLPDTSSTFLTTFKGNLTAIGNKLEALSGSSMTWFDKGTIQPATLETLPLVRSNTNQSQADSAIANGLVCTAFTDNVPVMGSNVPISKYVIADAVTGQNITAPIEIPVATGTPTGSPRVFVLGNYFVIVFTNVITATPHLQYIAISTVNPLSVSANQNISSQYTPNNNVAFDGIVATNNNLYLGWNGSDVGGAIRMTRIDSSLNQHNTVVYSTFSATTMSLTADNSGSSPIIYNTFYNSSSMLGYTLAVDFNLAPVLAPTAILTGIVIPNITTIADSGLIHIYYEVFNTYSYDSSIQTDYIRTKTVTQAGVVGSPTTIVRSVGLAAKAFKVNGKIYLMTVYGSLFQPTYFVIDTSGNVIFKLANDNGGTYYALGLPSVTVSGNTAQVAYLIRDLVQSVNKTQGVVNAAGVYSQTGINLASFTIGISTTVTAETGNDLLLSGGFLWMYDGYTPVEQNFHLWPDYVETTPHATGGGMLFQKYFYQATYEWSDNQGNVFRSAPSIPVLADLTNEPTSPVTFDSVFASGDTVLTVSTTVGLSVGDTVTDNTTGGNITGGTTIILIDTVTNKITLSAPTAGNSAGTPGDQLQVTSHAIGSVTINVPTLRLTYKVANPVKIVLYRWSTAQENYYQVTSILVPLLNDTTIDSVSFLDTQSDAQLLGNNLIYTTGGVLENSGGPACNVLTLFDSRLWLVDAEDKNLLWYSKQVIETVPVEMSQFLTFFVPPSTASQATAGGPITALAAMDDKLIVFKKDTALYIAGSGPDNTGANSQYTDAISINATVGCTNQQSIVLMPQGLMFQSDKGIWLLDRSLQTSYIGAAVEQFNDAVVLSAINVPATNQVRFTLSNGITLMYDYYYGQWGTFINVPATSSTIYQGLHTYMNSFGQVFQETPGKYLDNSNPVLMSFTTGWMNLAGLQGYERFYFMYLLGQYITPFKLNVQFGFDYNSSPSQSVLVTPDNASPAWGGDPLWGSGTPWGGPGNVFESRVFPSIQKCEAFQIIINELFDSSVGQAAGAGLTLSGMNLIVGLKKSYRTQQAARSFG